MYLNHQIETDMLRNLSNDKYNNLFIFYKLKELFNVYLLFIFQP